MKYSDPVVKLNDFFVCDKIIIEDHFIYTYIIQLTTLINVLAVCKTYVE